MPAQITLSQDRFGVVIDCTGSVTGDELVEANSQVAACVNCRYQLWDFTDSTHVVVNSEAIYRLALQGAEIPEWSALEKIAVVGGHPSIEELIRIYEHYSTGWIGRRRPYVVRRFPLTDDALYWLSDKTTDLGSVSTERPRDTRP